MVPDVDIRGGGGLCNAIMVILVSSRVEASRIRVPVGVGRDCVDIGDDSSTLWYKVALFTVSAMAFEISARRKYHVVIILGDSMWLQ